MKIQRALKVRLYPTPEQAIFLNKTLGCCRFLYNHMLAEWIQVYKALKDDKEALRAYRYKTEKDYKALFEFLKKVDVLHYSRHEEAETLFFLVFPCFLVSFFPLEQAVVKRSKPQPQSLRFG
jgi:transposase